MGVVIEKYTSKYDIGDVIIFKKEKTLLLGIIEGYYIDDDCFWYNIRINFNKVYTYSNGGDIIEEDIIGKLEGNLKDECYKLLQTSLI